jgi:glycerol-3-phosphate dehydrogenase
MWDLCGSRVREFLESHAAGELLPGTMLPLAFVRWVIDHEWVQTLGDLVERRLMLLYQETLSEQTLRSLARCLVEAGLLQPSEIDAAVRAEIDRLRAFYGKSVTA